MTHSMRRAFTMVELMVVIAIIGILIALLMPGISGAWDVAKMTQCQTSLSALYKAQANWNADRDSTESRLNAGWGSVLQNYLESRMDTLACPSAINPMTGGDIVTGGGTSGTGGSTETGDDNDYLNPADEPNIELQDVTIGVTDNAGNTLYEIPLSPSPHWTMYQQWNTSDGYVHIGANIDNDHSLANAADKAFSNGAAIWHDEDFCFKVKFQGTAPIEVIIGDPDKCDGSANKYWTDFRLDHKPIFDGRRWLKMFASDLPAHTKVDVRKEIENQRKTTFTSQARATYTSWTVMSNSRTILGATSYGFNRGAYQMPDPDPVFFHGRDVPKPDQKLIFILDYPKAQADMTDIGDFLGDKTYFDDIFISPTPPTAWKEPPRLEGRTWEECQALRHFGKANVLFCDGHIESMEKDDLLLSKHKDLWNYQGK